MQTKAMAPSWQRAAAGIKVCTRKRVKDALSISPTPVANSRWRMRPEPHTNFQQRDNAYAASTSVQFPIVRWRFIRTRFRGGPTVSSPHALGREPLSIRPHSINFNVFYSYAYGYSHEVQL